MKKLLLFLLVIFVLVFGWIVYDTRGIPCRPYGDILNCAKGKAWFVYTRAKMRLYWLTHPKEKEEFQNTFIELGKSLKELENKIDELDKIR